MSFNPGINLRCAFAPFAHKTTLGRRKNRVGADLARPRSVRCFGISCPRPDFSVDRVPLGAPFVKAETCLVALKSLSGHMLLPFWREVTFDFDSPKNHWLFSVSDDAPRRKSFV